MIETKIVATCDLCECSLDVPDGVHPRDVKRKIPGVPAWKPSPVHFAMVEGGSMSWPFDLCSGCWDEAWKRLDPSGVLRKRIGAELGRHEANRSRV